MQILLIEDETKIVRFLERALGAHGHHLLSADNGEDGVLLATTEPVEFVLLDIMLPGLDGHQTLARIREKRPDLPVLMLTARDTVQDKVTALDAGADDYLTKPFALEELLACIRALSRRADQQRSTVLRASDLWMDVIARRVKRGEVQIDLSRREFSLLEYFLRHPGQVLTRGQILATIWEYDFDPESNVVDVYVRYLRKKIDRAGEPSLIATVRGAGYRLDTPADA
ncbi:MAG: response regulator transcription factor [Thermomicrobiales bacterium]